MFREYEVVMWSCFSMPKKIKELTDDLLENEVD